MPDLAKVLKEEIQRLARKETKASTASLRKDTATLKRAIADHKRRIAILERDNRRLLTRARKSLEGSVKASDEEIKTSRVTAKMIRGLRDKFGLSQAEMALLLEVSSQTVYQWEHKKGRLTFRGHSKAAIVELRKLSVAEVATRLTRLGE